MKRCRYAVRVTMATASPPVRGRGLKLVDDDLSGRHEGRPPCGGAD